MKRICPDSITKSTKRFDLREVIKDCKSFFILYKLVSIRISWWNNITTAIREFSFSKESSIGIDKSFSRGLFPSHNCSLSSNILSSFYKGLQPILNISRVSFSAFKTLSFLLSISQDLSMDFIFFCNSLVINTSFKPNMYRVSWI